MAVSAAVLFDFPVSAGVSSVTSRTRLAVSSISHFLSTLQSFLVSTLGWTLLDTGVSGLSANFVVKSSGVSGDRQICLKFGASTASQAASSLSCFTCVSFNSATDVAPNPTAEQQWTLHGANPATVWLVGDRDHVILVNDLLQGATSSAWLYAGLVDEVVSSVGATPAQIVIANSRGVDGTLANARMVESPTGTFNVAVNLQSSLGGNAVLNPNRGGAPDVNTGLVYLWPVVVVGDTTDRLYGLLKNCAMVGNPLSAGQELLSDVADYVAVGITNTTGTARGSLVVRTR
jgi:hypothetical protein